MGRKGSLVTCFSCTGRYLAFFARGRSLSFSGFSFFFLDEIDWDGATVCVCMN